MKLSFDELQIGQKLRTQYKEKENNSLMGYGDHCLTINWEWNVPADIILTVVAKSKSGKIVTVEYPEIPEIISNRDPNKKTRIKAGLKVRMYISELRMFTTEEGDIIPMDHEQKQYKIFFNGMPYKPKYFADMGKIKSSLLVAFGYFDHQYEEYQKYWQRNPELESSMAPEWVGSSNQLSRKDCKNVQIMEFINKDRKNPKVVDFDVQKYYDSSMRLINVTVQFGAAARELYKKTMETKEYSYMLVYIPEEYRIVIPQRYHYSIDYEKLKESDRIKEIMKDSGVKDLKKCTKHGKTAIVFKTLEDMKKVMLRLEPKEYFIMDCDGDQLMEKNTRFIKLIMIQEAADKEN